MTPGTRGSGICLRIRVPRVCSKAHSGLVLLDPRGLWRVVWESIFFSTLPTQLSSPNRCWGPTHEGLQEGMKWKESGGPGRRFGQETWGSRTSAMWVADFFASGWSGGENDLTCLKEPLAGAGIWGRGGVPRARQRGAWGLRTPPPRPGCSPAVAACGLAPEQGTDLPRGWHQLSGLFPASARKVRGADVGLTSHPAPPPPASPSGVHCCWEAGPPQGPGGGESPRK